ILMALPTPMVPRFYVNWWLALARKTKWPGCVIVLPNMVGQIQSSRICCNIYPKLLAAKFLAGLDGRDIPPVGRPCPGNSMTTNLLFTSLLRYVNIGWASVFIILLTVG